MKTIGRSIGMLFILAILSAQSVVGIEKYLYSYMNGCKYNWDCDYGMTCVGLICEPTMRLHSCSSDETCKEYGMQCINWYCRDPNNSYRNFIPGKRRSPGPWSRYLVNRIHKIKQLNDED
ncbi:uncharacterized protein [Ptychodera flava]|uniref:uncharacterized protein n=1 Tax=Ptychodera flava TaxID=63121 RepID=UPI00396A1C32